MIQYHEVTTLLFIGIDLLLNIYALQHNTERRQNGSIETLRRVVIDTNH